MKRLSFIICLGCGVLLVGWFGIYWGLHREPRYQGRTLTQWLDYYHESTIPGTSMADPSNARAQAREAVHAMGADAIPFLLARIEAPDARLKNRLRSLLQRQSVIHFDFKDPYEEQYVGALGMDMLGQQAMPAVPALLQLLKNPDKFIRYHALNCLAHLNPGRDILLPVLQKMVNDPDNSVRADAEVYLRRDFPEEAAERDFSSPTLTAVKTNSLVK